MDKIVYYMNNLWILSSLLILWAAKLVYMAKILVPME